MGAQAEFAGTQRFRIVSRIGEGGMGVVYEAVDRERDARVALKTLRTLGPDAILRFKKEFRALQDLEHPNLVSFGELIEQEGTWFFTMELVEGVDFLSYVRGVHVPSSDANTLSIEADSNVGGVALPPWKAPAAAGGGFDAKRLRASLGQLALGLHALHGVGKVHRDIKPSNIRVTHEGRVVLLDFGLVTETVPDPSATDAHMVGTPDYMAPEQAAAKPVGPEADWYAMGVVLYQALAGRVPYVGPALEVLMNKQRFEPAPPSEIASGVPEDLDLLCCELLRFEPSLRPNGRAVLRRLGIDPTAVERGAITTSSFSQTPPFVGRAVELAALRDAFADVDAGAPASVIVIAESGVGKSTLVRQFTDEVVAAARPAVVLQGRCHERESVPYKAVDGVVDALSRYLGNLSETQAAQLVPYNAALLAQVFPVLRRVRAMQQAPRPARAVVDPEELRARVFAALRDLLLRLGERRPLVIVIDDFQWADADSLALLGDVMRPPGAPCFLLLATARPGADAMIARLPGHVHRLELGTLAPAEARELVTLLAGGTGGIGAEGIIGEAGGHPLFIQELVRSAQTSGESGQPLELAQVLWSRIARLDEPARKVLQLLAVAGAPLDHRTVAHAAATPIDKLMRQIAQLRVAYLVRTVPGLEGPDSVECYHDRVRQAVLAHLDAASLAGCHHGLALALEASPQADPEALVLHWEAAGEAEKAAHYAVVAAARAAEALAFNRAAQLLETALALVRHTPEETRRLSRSLADALASAGRGFEAAQIYLGATEGAPDAEEIELTRLAAAQFLRSGHIVLGLETLGKVMDQLGMRVSPTRGRALGSLVLQRVRIALRGLAWKPRDATAIAPTELGRLDILYSASTCLGMIDHIRGADFQTRHLLAALKQGEPRRVCRALAIEVVFRSSEGRSDHPRVAALGAKVTEMAEQIGEPYLLGLAHMAHAARCVFALRYREGRIAFARAEKIFSSECVGAEWECVTCRYASLLSACYCGDFNDVAREVSSFLEDADRRGDLYARGLIACEPAAWVLVRDDRPDAALAQLDTALAGWPKDSVYMPHLYELNGRALALAYLGRGAEALSLIQGMLPALHKSMLLRVPMFEAGLLHHLGRVAILARAPAVALDSARRITAIRGPTTLGIQAMFRAGVANQAGREDAAVAQLRLAREHLAKSDLQPWFHATSHALGRRLGGTEGAELVEGAERALAAQGVRNLPRMMAMLAPGFEE